MVFYDSIKQEPLIWKEVHGERLLDYKEMYFQLIKDSFIVQSVVIDEKKGLREFFEKEKTYSILSFSSIINYFKIYYSQTKITSF